MQEIRVRIQYLLRKRKDGKKLEDVLNADIAQDTFPSYSAPKIKTNDVMYHLYQPELTGKAYLYLTGKFSYRSSRGNMYMLIDYHFDANVILSTPIRNRQAKPIKETWEVHLGKFTGAGVALNTWIMNNEASLVLKTALKKENVTYQLILPHNHRTNLAEKNICTSNNHFMAGLVSV